VFSKDKIGVIKSRNQRSAGSAKKAKDNKFWGLNKRILDLESENERLKDVLVAIPLECTNLAEARDMALGAFR